MRHSQIFVLSPKTLERLTTISTVLANSNVTICYHFDCTTNAVDIHLESYVFDSMTIELATLFAAVDVAVIDALSDGKICIEMRILNACTIVKEEK